MDFNEYIKKAQNHKQDFTLSSPLDSKQQEEVKLLEEAERLEEERLRFETEEELKQESMKQPMPNWDKKAKWAFLSLGYVGHSPKAPGTMGSLVAILLGLPILYYLQASNLILLALIVGGFAIKVINQYETEGGLHDDKRIVIDELVGVWVALAMIGFGVIEMLLAFGLFRLFDIWKPSVIGRVDQNIKGGLGVVGDDVLAGFFAGLLGLMIIGALQQLGIEMTGVFELPLSHE